MSEYERGFLKGSTHAVRLAVWMQVFKAGMKDDVSSYKAARAANKTVEVFDEKFFPEESDEVELDLSLDGKPEEEEQVSIDERRAEMKVEPSLDEKPLERQE